MRAGNRLTRDNAGRITSIGGDGATARGGRLRTASGGMRARQTAALRSTALQSGTIAKGGRGVSGSVARSLAAVKRERQGKPAAAPAARPATTRRTQKQATADPKKAGSIYNIPSSQLKRYRALTSAEYRQRREFRDQIDRSFSAYDKRDSSEMAKASKRADVAFRRSERMRSTLRKLSGMGSEGKAPELPTVRYMRPKSRRDRKDQGYIVRSNGRLSSSIYPKGSNGKGRRVDKVRMTGIRGVIKASRAKPQAPSRPQPTGSRTRSQAAAAYRARVNQMGKNAAAQRGFIAAVNKGKSFAPSDTRTIYRRGKSQQRTIFGGVETVGAGRMRQVGTRNDRGKVTLTRKRLR